MYNVKVVSDVHLEMYDIYAGIDKFIDVREDRIDIICLCGDIGDPSKHEYELFLQDCARIAKIMVFVILGNHEMYGKHPDETIQVVKGVVDKVGCEKIHFLNNTTYDIGEWRFLGTTLWSDIDSQYAWNIRTMMTDFQRIKGWSIGSHKEAYNANIAWLRLQCDLAEEDEKRVVVMTHHAPLLCLGHPRHRDSCLKSAFASDLHEFISRRSNIIRYWFYGHDHYSTRTNIDKTMIISNQVGYNSNDDSNFDSSIIIHLE